MKDEMKSDDRDRAEEFDRRRGQHAATSIQRQRATAMFCLE